MSSSSLQRPLNLPSFVWKLAVLLLPMIPGALLGPVILRRINQAMFENMVLVLTVAASLRLLF